MADTDKTLFLLDGMALAYRGHFGLIRNPRMTSSGINVSLVFAVTNTILGILNKNKPTHFAAAFDTPEPTHRHKMFKEYKAHRESMPEDLSLALPYLYRLIEAFNIPVLKNPGWEADDVIGTLAKQADEAASGLAAAQVKEAGAVALEKEGTAEATVLRLKFSSEATGIEEKAAAMKLFHDAGKEHEEFKLQLNKDKDIEIAAIDAQRTIAEAQAEIVGEALKTAHIDIVGGETEFFDKIVSAVKGGKAIDRFVYNSQVASDVKETFFTGDPDYFREKILGLIEDFNLSTDDVKDLSIAALITKMLGLGGGNDIRSELYRLLGIAHTSGISQTSSSLLLSRDAADGTKSGNPS